MDANKQALLVQYIHGKICQDFNAMNATTYNFNTAKLASKSYVFSEACAKTYCSNIFRFSGLYLQKQTKYTQQSKERYEIGELKIINQINSKVSLDDICKKLSAVIY